MSSWKIRERAKLFKFSFIFSSAALFDAERAPERAEGRQGRFGVRGGGRRSAFGPFLAEERPYYPGRRRCQVRRFIELGGLCSFHRKMIISRLPTPVRTDAFTT